MPDQRVLTFSGSSITMPTRVSHVIRVWPVFCDLALCVDKQPKNGNLSYFDASPHLTHGKLFRASMRNPGIYKSCVSYRSFHPLVFRLTLKLF